MEEMAKKLVSLQAQRTTAEAQRIAFANVDHLQAAFEQHVETLDSEILAITASRQSALPPHQLGQVIGQKQLEVADALKRKTDAEEKATNRLAKFDEYVKVVSDDFAAKMQALTEAQRLTTE